MTAPLPPRPESILQSAVGDAARGAAIVGDLREEYLARRPGAWRTISYWIACLAIAARYLPSTLVDVSRLDLRHAVRALAADKTFTATAVATLALGLGASATTFTVVYGALVRPLPFPAAASLVRWGQAPLGSAGINSVAVGNFVDLQQRTRLFEGLAAHSLVARNVVTPDLTERALGATVTWNFFDVLGVRPIAGRTFTSADDVEGAAPVVIVSERLWRRMAGERTSESIALGLDSVPHAVVGVMPAALTAPGDPQFWTTYRWSTQARAVRNRRQIEPIGRLRPGVTLAQGQSELRAIFADLARLYPADNGKATIAAQSFTTWMLGTDGPNRSLLPLVGAAASVLLLIALINVTNLTIGRAEARRHDHVLHQVLGASPLRQISRRAWESALVAAPALLGGWLIAIWGVRFVLTTYGDSIPRAATIEAGASTAVFLAVAAAGAAGAMALSARAARASAPILQDLARRPVTGRVRLRRRLVMIQIALAGGLLHGAVLLGATLFSLSRIDLGVPLRGALTFAIGVPTERYREHSRVRDYFATLVERIAAMPSVEAVGGTSRTPFSGGTNGAVASGDDPSRREPIAEWRTVTPGFFRAVGLTLVEGAGFEAAAAPQVIVSQALAASLFPDRSALGRTVVLEGSRYAIVGVVNDLRDFGPTRPSRPTVYLRHGSEAGFASMPALTIVVRTNAAPQSLAPSIRAIVRTLDPEVPIQRVATLEELAHRSLGASRTTAASLVTAFAAVALLLGAIGVYGVVALGVEQRTREFGVRLAIGETPAGIVRLVLRDGYRLAAAGLAAGSLVAWFVNRLVASLLVQSARPGHAATVAGVMALLAAATFLACVVPARRAARMSPTDALRAE